MKKFIRIICFVIAIFNFCVIFNSCGLSTPVTYNVAIKDGFLYNFDNNNYWYTITFEGAPYSNYAGSKDVYYTAPVYSTYNYSNRYNSFQERIDNDEYCIKELFIAKHYTYIVILYKDGKESTNYYYNKNVEIIKEPKG